VTYPGRVLHSVRTAPGRSSLGAFRRSRLAFLGAALLGAARWGAALLGTYLVLSPGTSSAAHSVEPSTAPAAEAALVASAEAIDRAAYTEAIERLELLADQGFLHPDASYNRGLAYLGRSRTQGALPGDRGRAIASFKEALLHRPEDASAEAWLDRVQQELGRERARRGAVPPLATPHPIRAILGLLHENTWAALAALSSLLATLGLLLRQGALLSRWGSVAGPLTLAGAILASVGGLGLASTGAAAALAQSLRHSTRPAVVVADSARLLDSRGRPLETPALPEGTEVFVLATEGHLVRIERTGGEAWLQRSDIRALAPPSDLRAPYSGLPLP
jgi:tetratricopeptide (TPR) repeat protein